ncbi:hypothetical protein L6R50_07450 [Myxococcota bacterium]|nr:hypothetical protein [Myxococcota bacterium]
MNGRTPFLLLACTLAAGACRGADDAELTLVEDPPAPEGEATVASGSGSTSGGASRGGGAVVHAYDGWHPEPAGSWCRIEGRHRHPYALAASDYAVSVIDDVYYFVGDALAWGWTGPVWWYYGHHRISSRVWCVLDGPHSHAWKPTFEVARFRLDGGYYTWTGDWDDDYRVAVKRYGRPYNDLLRVRLVGAPSHPWVSWGVDAKARVDHGRHRGEVRLAPPPAHVRVDFTPPRPPVPGHPGRGIDVDVRVGAGGASHSYTGSDHRREGAERDGRDVDRDHRYTGADHRRDDGDRDRGRDQRSTGSDHRKDRDDRDSDRDRRSTGSERGGDRGGRDGDSERHERKVGADSRPEGKRGEAAGSGGTRSGGEKSRDGGRAGVSESRSGKSSGKGGDGRSSDKGERGRSSGKSRGGDRDDKDDKDKKDRGR